MILQYYSHSAPVFYPILDEGFQVWLGDRKLSSSRSAFFKIIFMARHFCLGIPLIYVSLLVTNGILIGTFVKLPCAAFPWDAEDGSRNTPLDSAVWVLKWFSGENNPHQPVLDATSQKTRVMCGVAKNRQFSSFGPS
jgi:hypothetical protein